MGTNAGRLSTIVAFAALVALPTAAWADWGFSFGIGYGGYGGGYYSPYGGVSLGQPWFGGPFGYGQPSFGYLGGYGGWGGRAGLSGWGGGSIRTGRAADPWAGVRSLLRSQYPSPGEVPEIEPQRSDTPVEFRARQVAPRLLEVTWPGSEEPVAQVVFELLGANDEVIDKRYELEAPYKGFLNVTSKARYVRVTVTYADGLERSVKVPFEPPGVQ